MLAPGISIALFLIQLEHKRVFCHGLHIKIQSDYEWYEWLHKFIGKKVTAIQKLNPHHHKVQLCFLPSVCITAKCAENS
jgi:hypothetical protein